MTKQCPQTCRRCDPTSSTKVPPSNCTDLVNPATGISDCPRLRDLCTNSNYRVLMKEQCSLTCGFCSDNVTPKICEDQKNPKTGVSECPQNANLCQRKNYVDLMRIQCPKTCGYC
uniref:ShTK domain protein n=1 Tax=Heterorhabditis bacteriophora TaxID=37862 RepID=A0A1I7XFS1_HETBA